jgi:hypothetical protein
MFIAKFRRYADQDVQGEWKTNDSEEWTLDIGTGITHWTPLPDPPCVDLAEQI